MKVAYELVRDWMSQEVVTVTVGTLLTEAYQLMVEHEIRRLPVVSYEEGDDNVPYLKGIVTYGDLRSAEPSSVTSLSVWEAKFLMNELHVEKFMSHDPLTVRATDTIGEAAQVMLENKVSGLPVVGTEQRLVGILTESDIFRMVVTHEWQSRADVG